MFQPPHKPGATTSAPTGTVNLQSRLKFLNFTERDEELLKALRPVFEQNVPSVVNAFYERLLGFPEPKQLLSDPAMLARLKKIQSDYLMRLTAGNYDKAYAMERLRVGQMHERAGWELSWYIGGYNVYVSLLMPHIAAFCGNDQQRIIDTMLALTKILTFDMELAMDAYLASDRYRHFQQFESIVKDSADAIFLLDMDTKFRAWNSAAERIFGWRAEEILGKSLTVILPEDVQRSGEMERINREVMSTGHFRLETVRLAKDGRRVPVEVTVSLLRDPQGNPLGRSAILRDITERKRLQEGNLQAERLAVVGTMSAKLAHEIRNPLSAIGLNLGLLRDEIDVQRLFAAVCTAANAAESDTFKKSISEATDLTNSIYSEVHRIRNVLEDYLKFARLPRIQLEAMSLNDLLRKHLDFMQPMLASARVALETHFDASLPDIAADDEQFWQAVLNLIRNSIEAMPNGGTLRITTRRLAESGVALEVADTGCGMTPEIREKVFAPFFSTKQGGTGLGMPLTLQIVTEHGGTIQCDSVPGKGTTVTITCPCARK